ncbi:tripartite ATP-independent transporter DctP family solute receptor [Rhizobium sp. PP-F2F-G38]|uniref:TRAP transporter substrate-binding protein n=1 Tax=Ferranicluibacter rubi TaxID=2715133 RepID=A0AA43ZGL8_9HYPH|nr:TRAP transporter substrate-binding protein [Ferranicluibacter rubi]NHT77249.1 TRAP transporter substrate-binding protein [Ferranicluibacter rubi]PYE34157.1 tripartite ATP-independent transporter DctP family solute receptor [Rhizobium sp. PP-WC-1G-195]PYE96793.1 tripartite ATP-independent transporter DctP family solute receptor [Rhizobium sp. PP-F2F-G38]TCQ23522.1 tripartite ATP-independent transporter DctP family solute receptor [Rhizobium sp. PP-CC-3G-465]
MRLTQSIAALLAAASIFGAAGAHAEISERTIKFAAQNSKGHPQVMGMERFAEIVKEKSGGKIEVKLFPGGTLGGDVQTLASVQGGIVEMSVLNAGILSGTIKEFGVVDLPFLFGTPEEADAVMDGPVGTDLSARLPAQRLVGLGFWELGFRHLTNNRHAVNTVEDVKGLKIRTVQSAVPLATFNALGANAIPLPYPELYSALETGTVDGQENPLANIVNAKFTEVQKYLTLTGHQYNPQIVIVSKVFWDKLDPQEQALLQDAATQARDYQRKASRDANAGFLAEIKKSGMEVVEPTAEQLAAFRKAVEPVVAQFRDTIGAETVDAVFSQLKTIRGQ